MRLYTYLAMIWLDPGQDGDTTLDFNASKID